MPSGRIFERKTKEMDAGADRGFGYNAVVRHRPGKVTTRAPEEWINKRYVGRYLGISESPTYCLSPSQRRVKANDPAAYEKPNAKHRIRITHTYMRIGYPRLQKLTNTRCGLSAMPFLIAMYYGYSLARLVECRGAGVGHPRWTWPVGD